MKQELRYVLLDLQSECSPITRSDEIPDDPRRHAARIADYFYTVRVLVAAGVVNGILIC